MRRPRSRVRSKPCHHVVQGASNSKRRWRVNRRSEGNVEQPVQSAEEIDVPTLAPPGLIVYCKSQRANVCLSRFTSPVSPSLCPGARCSASIISRLFDPSNVVGQVEFHSHGRYLEAASTMVDF